MAGLVSTEAARLLTDSLVTGGGRQMAVSTTAPSATSVGSEFATKQPVTFASPTIVGGVQTCTNTTAVTFTNLTAGSWSWVNIYNGASERRWFGQLTAAKTTQAGDSILFAAGSVSVGLS